jgi:acetyl-CoA carboxylase biotin carboxyl carrier protein
MTTAERLRLLDHWLNGTDIALLELTTPRESLRLRRDDAGAAPPAVAPAPASAPASAPVSARTRPGGTVIVTSPSPGVFLHRHPLHAAPAAPLGQPVRAGAVLGLLRIGKLLLAVTAPRDGVVAEFIAAEGGTVGYGAALVRLAAAEGREA